MTLPDRLLRLFLDSPKAAALLGDLEEEAARLGASRGWIWRQALRCACSAAWLAAVRIRPFDVLAQDLRYNARIIRREGALSIAVLLTLIVGLGMNSVVFSLFNGLLFRPWAMRDPGSFVQIYARPSGLWRPASDGPDTMVTLEDFNVIRSATRTLSAVTVERQASFRLGEDEGMSLRGVFVSCNFLSAHLGPMRLGRGLLDSDCSMPGLEPAVVVSQLGWERYFAGDPNIIGRTLRLNDHPVTVVGVAPDDAVGGPVAAMVYVPYTMQPVLQGPTDYFREPPGLHAWLHLQGRLAAGHTISEAQAELTIIGQSLDRLHPAAPDAPRGDLRERHRRADPGQHHGQQPDRRLRGVRQRAGDQHGRGAHRAHLHRRPGRLPGRTGRHRLHPAEPAGRQRRQHQPDVHRQPVLRAGRRDLEAAGPGRGTG